MPHENSNGIHPTAVSTAESRRLLFESLQAEVDMRRPEVPSKELMEARIATDKTAIDYYSTRIERNLLESWCTSNWGGSDDFYKLRLQTGALPYPQAVPSDRQGGSKWPIWRTEQELKRLLQESRILVATNPYCQGLLRNQVNYTIGKGFSYKARAKDVLPYKYRKGKDEKLVAKFQDKEFIEDLRDQTQEVIDGFLAHNHWNSAVNPLSDEQQGAAPREQEAYRRAYRDGHALVRHFFHGRPKVKVQNSLARPCLTRRTPDGNVVEDHGGARKYDNYNTTLRELMSDWVEEADECPEDLYGKVTVRFIDPELLANPPGASWSNGWALGRRFRVDPAVDLETTLEWFVLTHDPSIQHEDPKKNRLTGPKGEFVPGWQVVQIKLPDEDAEVGCGTPSYTFDKAEALRRASRIQQYGSETAAERARVAFWWKHLYGSQNQIQQMVAGLSQTGAVGGGPGGAGYNSPLFTQAVGPPWLKGGGVTGRSPFGQEPVTPSGDTGLEEQMHVKQNDLMQAGAAHCMPEAMISGDYSNCNMASMKEAGTPFVRNGETEQEHFGVCFLRCVWKAVRWAVECGILPPEVLDVLTIDALPSEIKQTNVNETTMAASQNLQNKITSPQIEAAKIGNDPKKVQQDWLEWNEQMGQQGGGMGLPQQVPGQEQGQEQGGGGAPGGLAGLFGGGGQEQGQQPPQQGAEQPPPAGGQPVPESKQGDRVGALLEALNKGSWLELPDELLFS